MPSGLTHILLTKKLQDMIPDGDLKDTFAFGSDALQIGAVAPDIPYASIADNSILTSCAHLADDFHYKYTNQIPIKSLSLLRELKDKVDNRSHRFIFSFYLGYISHVFADGIIHPFVRDKVGNYNENEAEHRRLEMELDVLLYRHFTESSGLKFEINYANIHDELLDFSKNEVAAIIVNTFSTLIGDIYKEKFTPSEIFGWIEGLHRLFALAEGEFPAFFRRSKFNTVKYKNFDDIDMGKTLNLSKPKDRDINFLKAENINFINDCVPKYFSKYIKMAQKVYNFIYQNGAPLDENDIPMINLDTGRLVSNDSLDEIPILWLNS